MLIDTHCHLYFDRFDSDRDAVIARMAEAGVDGAIVIGIDAESCEQARWLAASHPQLRYAVGLHPTSEFPAEVLAGEPFDPRTYLAPWLDGELRPIAIGECGIDLHWDANALPAQQRVFRAQLELARALELPVVVHTRDADNETLDVLNAVPGTRGVLHCFNGSLKLLEFALAHAGWFISFAGNLTFPKAVELHTAASQVPLDRLLVETDAPFLAPQPRRGKRCEPGDVVHVARYLAELHGVAQAELAQQLRSNSERCFQTKW